MLPKNIAILNEIEFNENNKLFTDVRVYVWYLMNRIFILFINFYFWMKNFLIYQLMLYIEYSF